VSLESISATHLLQIILQDFASYAGRSALYWYLNSERVSLAPEIGSRSCIFMNEPQDSTNPFFFTSMRLCILTNFFTIKPTRHTNFSNFFLVRKSICFGQFLCPSSGVYSLYIRHWYMSYRFEDSFRAGPGWNWL
jgi:hypothetical protein